MHVLIGCNCQQGVRQDRLNERKELMLHLLKLIANGDGEG